MGKADYQELIRQNDEKERQFQDSVMEKLNSIGIHIQLYSSRKYQWTKGECIQGVEIKHDHKIRLKDRLFIEYQERDKNGNWCDSGIFRTDNSWLYCIGDEDRLYIFLKCVLVNMFNNMKTLQKIETPTSKGFFLDVKMAEKWCKVL
jgi:hypothetical protein